nr:hypothetical protein B0A51_01828 [Rachicladosporium sp. CCFEE 5018]
MGKPRMIILIRHAQSEGNKNREVHQIIPDHRVKLTEEGWGQAEEAGRRLRTLLRPDDTLQFYTSPYRRTRETTEGILRTLTSPSEATSAPSPFSRHAIKVYEEPRIREQDFGNFQPCSTEMERMWQERADYGHFFYRIPNGESAADAYDRISGFNESLWRSFGDDDFPSVCVLVTHGLMSRVFLMKCKYHWSVEYFEDLRNVNHTEFLILEKQAESGKYQLQSELRTWSELKRQKAEDAARNAQANAIPPDPQRRNTLSQFLPAQAQRKPSATTSTAIPTQKWGGCAAGCDHHHDRYPRRTQRKPTTDSGASPSLNVVDQLFKKSSTRRASGTHPAAAREPSPKSPPVDGAADSSQRLSAATSPHLGFPTPGRDGGGTDSGAPTPQLSDENENDNDYFPPSHPPSQRTAAQQPPFGNSLATALSSTSLTVPQGGVSSTGHAKTGSVKRRPVRRPTVEDIQRWEEESGMGKGKMADALGDEPEEDQGIEEGDGGDRSGGRSSVREDVY